MNALFEKALAHHQNGQIDQAKQLYIAILQQDPSHFDSLHLLGLILSDDGQLGEAETLIRAALKIKNTVPEPHYNLGNLFMKRLDFEQALVSFDNAIHLNLKDDAVYTNRGNALVELCRTEDALESYKKALEKNPKSAKALNNYAKTLKDLGQFEDALIGFNNALMINPSFAEAYNNRGNTYNELKLLDKALTDFDRALDINPDYSEAFYNKGNVLIALDRTEEAQLSLEKSILLNDAKPDAYRNLATIHLRNGRLEEACNCYQKAFTLNPDGDFLLGNYLQTKMRMCDWSNFSESLLLLESFIKASKKVCTPFPALALTDKPAIHLNVAKLYCETRYAPKSTTALTSKIQSNGKIRIGYFSPDFRDHPVSFLIVEMLESHNRDQFEIFGFAFGPRTTDDIGQRINAAFDHVIDIRDMTDQEVVALAHSHDIHIAIDLCGHTTHSRTAIFAQRAAPIQANYLGYIGTSGAHFMDYLIADPIVIPISAQHHYTEKIVYLPDCFQANDSQRKISNRTFTRSELGLPESGFVFCCFNNNYKILPETFASWMRILKSVPGSILWLLEDNPFVTKNLIREAESQDIQRSRLVFAKRIPQIDYLARYKVADLFLDTYPYNAGTTASDALWSGLPVLTRSGSAFVSRMAASLLHCIGLPDLISETQDDYEAKAIKIGLNPSLLHELKTRLEHNRLKSTLFDGKRLAVNLEAAFTEMYERYKAGQPNAHIHITKPPSVS